LRAELVIPLASSRRTNHLAMNVRWMSLLEFRLQAVFAYFRRYEDRLKAELQRNTHPRLTLPAVGQ